MSWPVAGKVVLVTGAARGIGAETARAAAARGARLALVGLEPEALAAVAASLGPAHTWQECDVTDQAALDRAVACVAETLGGIDVVVANAGVANNGTVAANPVAALARTIEVNLIGVVRTRCGNAVDRPRVTLKAPPYGSAMSSPSSTTRRSSVRAPRSVSLSSLAKITAGPSPSPRPRPARPPPRRRSCSGRCRRAAARGAYRPEAGSPRAGTAR